MSGIWLLKMACIPICLLLPSVPGEGEVRNIFDGLGTILPPEDTEAFKEFADFEKRMLWHKEHTFKGYPFAYVKQTNVKWNITDAFPNGGDMDKVFPPEQELKDTYHYNGNTYGVRQAIGAGIYLRHVWGTFVPGFYADPKEDHTAYAYTWVYSPKDQEVGLWQNFRIIAVRRWIWLRCKVNGIIKVAVFGLMIGR